MRLERLNSFSVLLVAPTMHECMKQPASSTMFNKFIFESLYILGDFLPWINVRTSLYLSVNNMLPMTKQTYTWREKKIVFYHMLQIATHKTDNSTQPQTHTHTQTHTQTHRDTLPDEMWLQILETHQRHSVITEERNSVAIKKHLCEEL